MQIIRGAAEGQGLGNAFLSHISAVDGIFHVCRAFEDADVVHVEDRSIVYVQYITSSCNSDVGIIVVRMRDLGGSNVMILLC